MARIPLVREDDPATPPEAREFLKRVEGGLGEVFNAVRLLANNPQQASALINFVRSVRHNNQLTPTLTELAYTTASVVNGCHYWVPHHKMLGRGIGISEEKLRHLGDDPLPGGIYSEAEAAIIRYAQKSTRLLPIDDYTYQALAKYFSVPQIIEICLNVGLAQITNRFNATFLTEVDDYIVDANEKAAD
jgi:AhpD family alkylhydroperoxidase